MYDKVGSCELDGYSGGYDKLESAHGKRKLSPRSMMRVNKLVRKRVMELKKEQVAADDGKSMQLLVQTLRMQRGGEGGTDGSKKDKSKKTDKALLHSSILEDNSTNVCGHVLERLHLNSIPSKPIQYHGIAIKVSGYTVSTLAILCKFHH